MATANISVGKSVLASVIIEELEGRAGVKILYFYCRYDDPQKQTFVAMARTFLQQLLRIDENIVAYLYETAISDGNASLSSRKTAETLLETCLAAAGQVYIVLDGVDECPLVEQKALVKWLREYTETSRSTQEPSHCLFLSQYDGNTLSMFSGLPTLMVTTVDNEGDIKSFCQRRMQEFPAELCLRHAEATDISNRIAERADGMCLQQ
jgi:hypothetical protein